MSSPADDLDGSGSDSGSGSGSYSGSSLGRFMRQPYKTVAARAHVEP